MKQSVLWRYGGVCFDCKHFDRGTWFIQIPFCVECGRSDVRTVLYRETTRRRWHKPWTWFLRPEIVLSEITAFRPKPQSFGNTPSDGFRQQRFPQ